MTPVQNIRTVWKQRSSVGKAEATLSVSVSAGECDESDRCVWRHDTCIN